VASRAMPTSEQAPLLAPRPRDERRRAPSLVDVTLDPAQREAVALPAGGALLVLGEAGHGKTTVALHRLAHVWKEARAAGREARAAVVVPTEGLARLLQPLLRRLGVDVEALTYDRWAAAQARRAFRRLPRESELTPPAVMRVKRDAALRIALEELAGGAPGVVDDDIDAPRTRTRAHAVRADLQHLFGDRLLLERVAAGSPAIGRRAIDEVLDRTRIQFGLTAEEEWSHVDAGRLVAVDRRAIDEGTASGDVKTVDVEDYAVLFELDRMRAARRGAAPTAPRAYDILLLDEAQELAPLELALIGRSLAADGTLIVAGDADQQTDATTSFRGWDSTMAELAAREHATVRLEVGYRCPPGVVALARHVLGEPPRAGESSEAPRGAEPTFLREDDEPALARRLGSELASLLRRDPRASVAVLCRSPLTARRIVVGLREETPARLVFDGRFLARGPVQVTTVDEVKGLEFDFVVVPDANARDYPDDAASRRLLYVAVTRARHQVLLACAGSPTPLAPFGASTAIAP
jgi:DNA helicase-2/ATP-dependent DNA helicase PcrA